MTRPRRTGPVVIRRNFGRLHCVHPSRRYPTDSRGPTRYEVERDGWRRTSYGLWVPPGVDGTMLDQRIVEAAANLGEFGAVTGWAALAWLGSRWLAGTGPDGSRLPIVLAADNKRWPANAVLSEERLPPGEMLQVDGVVITLPVRSLTFEMRYAAGVRQAVVWFDMVAYDDFVSLADVEEYLPSLSGWTGVPQLRAALPLVDENSWSPQETRLRLVWVLDAALPPPLCNRPVFSTDGVHLGTPDLLDEPSGLLVQYDGPDHLDPARRELDLIQDAAYADAGLVVERVTVADLRHRRRLVDRLVAARTEALARSGPRDWTVDAPDWWVATHTVALRRALDPGQAGRWLRYRMDDAA